VILRAVEPYAGSALIAYLAARAIPGLEEVVDGVYTRALGSGTVSLRAVPGGIDASVDCAEVRALLDAVGLPFEPACLRFYETDRAVRTASSEQVRRPIFREGLDQWRQFDRWLGPLRDSLGTVVDEYPFAT